LTDDVPIRFMRFFSKLPSPDLRLTSSLVGILAQGAAWACGTIAILLTTSKMPFLFHRIPPEIQFACEALVVLAAVLIVRMLVERGRILRAYAQLSDSLARFRPSGRQDRTAGVPPETIERVLAGCDYLTGSPREWWLAVAEALEFYESPEGGEGWFLTRPVREILPDEELIEPFYHASFHQSVPGILTALGLLTTFTAILVALSGVSYNAANTAQPVMGIDSLINGLSGKFLSSIIALILSMIFTFLEKKACERRIYRDADALRSLISRVFPYLSQTRILLDLQRIALASRPEPLVVAAVRGEAPPEPWMEPATEPLPLPTEVAGTAVAPEPAEPAQAPNPEEGDSFAAQFGI
jgi:hypothetical protein